MYFDGWSNLNMLHGVSTENLVKCIRTLFKILKSRQVVFCKTEKKNGNIHEFDLFIVFNCLYCICIMNCSKVNRVKLSQYAFISALGYSKSFPSICICIDIDTGWIMVLILILTLNTWFVISGLNSNVSKRSIASVFMTAVKRLFLANGCGSVYKLKQGISQL